MVAIHAEDGDVKPGGHFGAFCCKKANAGPEFHLVPSLPFVHYSYSTPEYSSYTYTSPLHLVILTDTHHPVMWAVDVVLRE